MDKRLAGALACTVALCGCAAGSNFSIEDAANIKTGMTKDEVTATLGRPTQKIMRVGSEIWTWASVNLLTGESRVASVTFVDGKVTETHGTTRVISQP